MNKKLFGTLLLGSLLMGGTFVSCKDYDDDIENLQGQISGVESQVTDVKALVAQLQSKLDGMTYVQSVTKSSDGKTIKFTMSNGQTVEFTDTDTVSDPGSVVTVEDGVLCIDGKPTEIKVASAINMPKVENGQIYVFDEETGEYAATGIFVNQNNVVESATKYTITMTQYDGTTATFDVPKASGLITSIVVNNNYKQPIDQSSSVDVAALEFYMYNVTATQMDDDWKGPKPKLKNGNIVFGFSTLDIRVNPVSVDLKDVKFSLVNTKNETLPSVTLLAKPEDGDKPLTWNEIGTRAHEGNGLWTLYSDNVVIEKSINNTTLDKKVNVSTAYAVTAGEDSRSSYNVKARLFIGGELDWVYFHKEDKSTFDTEAAKVDGTDNGEVTLEVNKAYSLVAHKDMALYDVFMSVDDLTKETYGVEIDNTNRTIKYTKQPDVVSTDLSFDVTIKTADNYGQVKTCTITVKLSSKINTASQFEAQTFNLANLDSDGNGKIVVSLDPLKTALGSGYNRWANNVALANTSVAYYSDASCADWSFVNGTVKPTIETVKANGDATTTVTELSSIKFKFDKNQTALKIGKQYYAKVTFKNKEQNPSEINSIVIPVKFTAPTVAEQFKPKAGYVVDGVINAYFYDVDKAAVTLSRYFDAKDDNAKLTLKTDDKLVKIADKDKNSSDLAEFVGAPAKPTVANDLKLTAEKVNDNDATEAGYGKVLTVNVENANYANTSWAYDAEADSKTSFQIKIMSPIYQGTIKPAEGASVKLVANSVDGSNITSEMIVATDYTGTNKIEIMPDAKGATAGNNYWKNDQIANVAVEPARGDTYVKSTDLMPVTLDKDGNITKIGYINVKANPVANDVDTKIVIYVTDAWNYTKIVDLPVTITKQ